MSASGAAQAIEGKASEPSMEEILASIRRIIADDQAALQKPQAKAAPQPVAPPPPRPAPVEPDVLDLADVAQVAVEPEPVMAPEPVRAAPAAPPPPPVAVVPPAPEPPSALAMADDERLMSDTARSAASTAFQSLTRTVVLSHGRTLDDIVSDMMRPMLREWLDENLPGIVERLVKAEIERVARGR